MSHEDTYYEIYTEVRKQGISEQFYAQLEKMKRQDKHKYKDTKQLWEYAYEKVKKNEK